MKKLIFVLLALFIGQAYAQQGRPSTDFGSSKIIKVQFNRPANVTAYAANDAVTNSTSAGVPIAFDRAARFKGGSGYVTSVTISADTANATNATFDLILYSDSASVATPADNAAFPLDSTNNGKRIGVVQIAFQTYGTGSTAAIGTASNLNIPFQCESYSDNIYGILVAKAAYQPKHTGRFTIRLSVERN